MEKLSDEKMLQIRTAIQKAELDEFLNSLKREDYKLEINVNSPTLEQDLISAVESGQQLRYGEQQWIIRAVASKLISDFIIERMLKHGYDGFWWPLDELVFALDSGAMSQDTLKCILENQNFHLKDDFVIALVHRMIEHKLPEDFILKLIHHHYCCLPSPMVQMILEAVTAKKINPIYLQELIQRQHQFGDILDLQIIQYTINGNLHPCFLELMIKLHYHFSTFNEKILLTSGIDFGVKKYLVKYHPELFDMV